jgi:hypothetical protein
MSRAMLGALIVVLVFTTAAAGPPAPIARMRFFDCAVVQFFGEACTSTTDDTPASPISGPEAAVSTPTLPPTESLPSLSNAAPADASVPQASLFTQETVSPDTPPLLLRLLQAPTEANARAFLAWYQARLARIQQVQALIDALSTTATTPASLKTSERSAPVQGLHLSPTPLLPPPAVPITPVD